MRHKPENISKNNAVINSQFYYWTKIEREMLH